MRISKNDLSRSDSKKEIRKKVFAMLEGTETEPNYFVNLFNTQKFKEVDFRYFQRENKEKGWSNPKKLMDYLLTIVNNNLNGMMFHDVEETVFSYINNCDIDLDYCAFKVEFNKIRRSKNIKDNDFFDKEKFNEILQELKNTSFKSLLYNDFDTLLEEARVLLNITTYDPQIDRIVLIVDRDKDSFSKKQYDYILQKVRNSNVDFLVTNPCFEFYLALHIDDCSDVNIKELLDNKKCEDGNSYAYNYLKGKENNYSKSLVNVDFYVQRYEDAIINSKKYETDIKELKNKVGSNIGLWIEKMTK